MAGIACVKSSLLYVSYVYLVNGLLAPFITCIRNCLWLLRQRWRLSTTVRCNRRGVGICIAT